MNYDQPLFKQHHQEYHLHKYYFLHRSVYQIMQQMFDSEEHVEFWVDKSKDPYYCHMIWRDYTYYDIKLFKYEKIIQKCRQQKQLQKFKLLHNQIYLLSQKYYIIISNYLDINNKMATISDDPSVIQPIFNEIKKNMKSQQTRDLSFRKSALKNLLRGYKEMREKFDEALKQDLGYNSFMSVFSAHSIFESEIDHIISHFQSWAKPSSISTPVGLGLACCALQQQPLGVALVLSAWNYPIYTALPQVAYAICAGNAVILKPSQVASYTSNCLLSLFNKYMDSRFYRVIQGKVQVAKAITKLPFDVICFTGSTVTGRLVAMEAAKNLTPCILQLGGKCPVIVDETAKVESAVMRILFGKYFNCGQTCIGVDHVYVHSTLKQAFKTQLLKKTEQFYANGQNLADEGNYGKIINDFHIKRLSKMIKDDHKGQIIYGGQIDQSKLYIEPTIIWQPAKTSILMQSQIFGPILPVFQYTNLEEVIQEINNRDKPLVVYHFSQNKKLIETVQHSTSSGAYVVNDTVVQNLNNELPFGGVGKSGYGRFHGKTGLLAFSNPKSICKTMAINSYPLNVRFPPYTESKKGAISMLVKFGSLTYDKIFKVVIALVILIALIVCAAVLIPTLTHKQ